MTAYAGLPVPLPVPLSVPLPVPLPVPFPAPCPGGAGRPGQSRWAARIRRATLATLAWAALLAGCAEHRLRREAEDTARRGEPEAAIRQLEAGLAAHPDSALLRAGWLRLRSEAVARRLAAASALRAEGQWAAAEAELRAARSIDPTHARIDAWMAEIDVARRQQQSLADAEAAAASGAPEDLARALQIVEQALTLGPRQAALLALRRRLELDLGAGSRTTPAAALGTGRLTLDFRDAPLRTVLDVVTRHSGVNFVLDRELRAQDSITVYLRDATVEEALDLLASAGQWSRKTLDARTVVLYPNTPDKQRQYQEQVVRVFHLASADAAGAAAFLRAMLRIQPPHVDERQNLVSMRDTPDNIRLAERLLSLYDVPEPEVLLDVEVLEISSTRLTELGVKFPDTLSLTPLSAPGGSGLTLDSLSGLTRDRIGVGVGGLLLNLRREVGDLTTLAHPRIRVRHRQSARILIGDKVPVITTTVGTGGFVSDSVNYLDVGLKLEVEPTVHADDDVAIKVALEVSSLGTPIKTASGTLAYQIGTRNASTLLRLRDGETQLLAGLISRDDRVSASRVPGVGDLPVLGRLFSSQLDSGQRTELVLAITPRIVRGPRRPSPQEAEVWVGTDSQPRWRPAHLRVPPAPSSERPVAAPRSAGRPDAADAPSAAGPGASDVAGVVASAATGAATGAGIAVATGAAPAATSSTTSPATTAPLRLSWSAPRSVPSGQEFEATLRVDTAAALRGLPLRLTYPSDRLQWISATEGEFLQRDGARVSVSQQLDPGGGRVHLALLRRSGTGVQGEGPLLKLRFRALTSGSATLSVDDLRPVWLTPGEGGVPQALAWTLQVE